MRNVEQFLEDVFGSNNQKINFRAIGEGSPIKKCGKYSTLKDNLKELNEKGYNIYYVVNVGGDKDENINKINAVYIDFDCGRDENKNYYPPEIVNKYKEEKIGVLNGSNLFCVPSYIVETRNGLHAYWLLSENISVDEFKNIQCYLIDLFKSDKAVKNPSRVMRLPDYEWTKDLENRFMCKIIQYLDVRYSMEDLGRKGVGYIREVESIIPLLSPTRSLKDLTQYEIIGCFMNRDFSTLKNYYNMPNVIVSNNNEFMDYIKKIDLRKVLGVRTTEAFKCVFHKDSSPSAHIFTNDNGHYFYKCHSSSCGVSYNILNIVEKLGGFKSRPKAFEFIKNVFNVKMELTDYQKEQIDMLEYNVNFLMFDLKDSYPEVYNNIRHNLDFLIKLNQFAKSRVFSEKMSDEDGNAIFHASNRELLEMAELSKNSDIKVIKKITLLQYHELINKLSDIDIPENMLKRAQAIQIEHGLTKRKNFYSIPSYTTLQMEDSSRQSYNWKNNFYTMAGLSREMIFRKEGAEIADKLYPQHTHVTKKINGERQTVARTTTEKQDEIHSIFTNIINECIEKNGYFRDTDLLDYMVILNEKAISKTATEKYFKRNLPEVLDNYGWIRMRANKEQKQRFGFDGKSSPSIIVKAEDTI